MAGFNPDGSLDPAFGTSGRVTTGISGGFAGFMPCSSSPAGRALAAGEGNTPTEVFLARYLG